MTYKVALSGGTKEESMRQVKRQVEGAMNNGNMTQESASQISRILEAMPGTHLSGTISDNNNGTVVVSITARTQVDASVVSKMKSSRTGNNQRPMEGAAGNAGGERVGGDGRTTTGAAAPASGKPTPVPTPAKGTTAAPAASGGSVQAQGANAGATGAGEGQQRTGEAATDPKK